MLFTKISKDDVYELMPSPTTVTTSEITALLENLYSGSYLEEEETDFLLSLMAKTSFDNRVDAGLVKGLAFSHKIGNWANTGSWHDCGVVDGPKKLVVCVMSKGTSFEDFLRVTESVGELVSKISIQSQK
jgi:beta-lactamase class A